ncbi:nuclear hormone receptor HR96-like isoform X2 [Pomacea canaliculata]|nr:nuclear hormone receptor HR96-like isoform X2 [Pomacea canaliculata]XP_025095027.1 nuclear hormone receptor HR96-like isoform X2 [Pomacea canaliculata]XP_025095028.1 nuclear hormone receptor HR96-like isoform X2 [Pomacea canaliculata]XP_025095029.1 nuclear hormone receptor HR96-like isoform X2 [Pomacea canaliculata]
MNSLSGFAKMMSSPEPSGDSENCTSENSRPSENESLSFKRHKAKNTKICGVCGDRALGYNFNAVTCESCKAFFRRNAFKDKQIKCLFKGDCIIDLRTRRFCPACRIKKCFEIGMKRDMILDENERKARMAKVLQNRVKKTSVQSTPNADIKSEPLDPDEYRVESSNISSPGFSECVQSPPAPSSEPPERVFQQIPRERLPADPLLYRRLTEEEDHMLKDFSYCYETTIAAVPDLDQAMRENYHNATDLVNNSEVCVRQLIKFVKQLEDFKLLRQEDQISALKSCIMRSVLLRSVAFYIVEKDAWLTLKGEIPTSILKEATGLCTLHNLHVRYCRTLKAVVQNNFTLYALMQVLIIFNPDGNNLIDRELISNLQDKYINILKHYLEAQYSYEHAHEYFAAILDRLSELKSVGEEHSRILLQVNPCQIEPLMLEVLNLK